MASERSRPRAPPFIDPPGYTRHRPEATPHIFAIDDRACMNMLRALNSTTRYPPSMTAWEFRGERFLLIPAQEALAPRVLLKITRTQ
jgi:hypothetical protein